MVAQGTTNTAKRADLVLEGGGVKGIGLVGAISVLEEAGYTFARVAGTSAGALVGSLVAAGMSSARMHDVMEALDYTKFSDETLIDHVPLIGKELSLLIDHAMYKGDYVRTWIAAQLAGAGVHTFADLAEDDPASSLPADQRYRLVVNASDVSRGQLLRLPWSYRPDFGLDPHAQRVADAVRASVSIPFFFQAVQLKPAMGKPSTVVDGGMLSNFPVAIFDRTDGKPPRWPTIGVKLSARQPADMIRHHIEGDLSLAEAMLGTMMGWYDQMHLDDPGVVARTIFVDTTGVVATDFAITAAQRLQLFDNGQRAARAWLAKQATPG